MHEVTANFATIGLICVAQFVALRNKYFAAGAEKSPFTDSPFVSDMSGLQKPANPLICLSRHMT
jgi:hypothetical protein